MRIDADIRVNRDDPWFQQLREERRLVPFNRLLSAINSSLSGQRYEAIRAEGAMTKSAALGVISAVIAVALYLLRQTGLAAILGLATVACAVNFAKALGKREAYSAETALIENYLVEAGFKLAWRKDSNSSQRLTVVTLEWPDN
ncbi:hypothetical protein [Sphingomonas sp.]|uniref:hypothetical protein n=1 Tax=Sphingomonas sp. TaxID=28214 RepID=UPI0038A3A11F